MRFLMCAAMAASLLAAGPAAGADKMYKWVDENGNVTYQDRPPPGESGQVQTIDQSSSQAPARGAAFPDVDITLYSIPECDACDLVRKLLSERGLPFAEKDADGDAEVQAELKEVAGVLSVPVLAIGDEAITGYNRELILNELEEAGFPTTPGSSAPAQARTQPGSGSSGSSGSDQLTREDLEGMTPAEIEQAARDAALRGEDNDLFDEDEGFLPNEDIFSDTREAPAGDDITQWEEIPEDERISVGE